MCLSLKRQAAVDMGLRSKAMSLTQGYSKVSRTGGASGAPWFGAALVVLPLSHTLIRADPQWIFVLSILDLWIDYQSGAEPRRSKGSADLRYFAIAISQGHCLTPEPRNRRRPEFR